jgi:effector-binding domain-containing protein
MSADVALVDARPRPLACVRVTTALSRWPGEFRRSLDKVYAAIREGKVEKGGHNVMVHRPRPDGLVDIECGVEVVERFANAGEVACGETPSGAAAAMVHVGPYARLGESHAAIAAWSRQNGRRLTGICWEIYGDWSDDPSKLRTDLFHLLRL